MTIRNCIRVAVTACLIGGFGSSAALAAGAKDYRNGNKSQDYLTIQMTNMKARGAKTRCSGNGLQECTISKGQRLQTPAAGKRKRNRR